MHQAHIEHDMDKHVSEPEGHRCLERGIYELLFLAVCELQFKEGSKRDRLSGPQGVMCQM